MFELLNLGRCHCNIAELLGWTKTFYGTNWNLLYFEYCNAGDIGRFLWESNRRETLIPEAFVWHVFSELTQAIDFLHNPPEEEERYPLMHLDIKPEKVFLTWTSDDHNHYPRVKLGDFGIAMSVPKDKGLKLTSNRGSWAYMSPEASAITSRVFPKSDVWGVGTVIHCMVHSSDTPPRSQENSCDPDAYGFDEDCSSPVNMIGNEYSPIDIEQIDPMERPFKNSYAEMYGKECPAHYSQALNDLMMKTLAVDRLKRIDTSSLLDVVVASEKDRRDLLFRPLPDWYQKMHYESMQRLDPVPIDIGNLEIPIVIDDDEPGPLESAKELYSKKKTEEIIIIKSQPEGPQAPNIHAPKRDVPESHTPKPTRITALQNKKTRKAREPKQSKKADPKKKPRKAREPQQAKKAIQKKTKKKR
ncbi:hypothetical protein MMC13_003459 [Lambiella insularis]|nr:hypothetical protein [Lambiella insularis]